jgi:hypothetical protein
MERKYQFFINGLGDIAKGKLYQIIPVDAENRNAEKPTGDYHKASVPMVETPAFVMSGESGFEGYFDRNFLCALVFQRLKASDNDLVIPEAIVNVAKRKRIVKTEIVGGSGTVKEFIGEDDMEITITLAVTATDQNGCMIDEYPGKEIKRIQKFLDAKTLDIWSPFLYLFNIDGGYFKVVVESYEISQSTHTNRQVITINAISDVDHTIFNEED